MKRNDFLLAAALFSLLFADPALAASGSTTVVSFFSSINSMLQTAAATIVTCAIIWAGLKILWMGAQIREVAGPFLGALLVGGASYFASLLV